MCERRSRDQTEQKTEIRIGIRISYVWSTEIIYAKFGFVFHINLDTYVYVIMPIEIKKKIFYVSVKM